MNSALHKFSVCVCVPHMCVPLMAEQEGNIRFPGTGVAGSRELPSVSARN